MGKVKTVKLIVDSFGSFLGMEKGCFVLRDKKGKTEKYPIFETEIGEVVLQSGNLVSTGALTTCGFWGIDVLVTTRAGRPIAVLKNLEDDAGVETRIAQYKALDNGKGIQIAKSIVLGKLLSQNQILRKYSLRQLDVMGVKERIEKLKGNLVFLRTRLTQIESTFSKLYFQEIFKLFPKMVRPESRKTFHAYDGLNNLFNLAYELLYWKCYRALLKAHLETHLGFVHTLKFARPSLVCDFQELYRYLIDDFLIGLSQSLEANDFKARVEVFNGKRASRIYMDKERTDEITDQIHEYFQKKVSLPRIRMGCHQEIESLINEEAILLALYLRNKSQGWMPRIALP
jgi:CRISPR-associated protein Cas1